MIVEERSYTLQPGTVPVFLKVSEERGLPIQQRHLGRLIGFFSSEIGTLNQVVHLWAYDSLGERERRRGEMVKDPEWQAYLKEAPKVIVRMENRILVPAAFSPLR